VSARPLRFLTVVWLTFAVMAPALRAAVSVPPAPTAHFNDYANFIPVDRARALDARLAQFERDTSNQLLVAIYPKLPVGAALEDYTVRAAQAWGVGRKDHDNGAVLFIFVADRALRIEVGYGLEGALTDAISHSIIENELKPRLRVGDPAAALDAAVGAMMAATSGEYRGTGRTNAEGNGAQTPSSPAGNLFLLFWFGLVIIMIVRHLRRSYVYGNRGGRYYRDSHPWSGPSSWGGWGGGGGHSSGGGFSGGGGGFGGGGASGKW
jgi:uncharacterized protein